MGVRQPCRVTRACRSRGLPARCRAGRQRCGSCWVLVLCGGLLTARAGGEAGAVVGQGYDPYQAVARQRTGRAAQDLVRGLPLPIVLPAVPSQGLADPTVSADAYQAILMVERLRQGGDRTSEALGWLSRQTTPRLVGLLDGSVPAMV